MDKSCFTCKFHPMCGIWNLIYDNLKLDTNSIEYNKKFEKLYQTVADCCIAYSVKEETK